MTKKTTKKTTKTTKVSTQKHPKKIIKPKKKKEVEEQLPRKINKKLTIIVIILLGILLIFSTYAWFSTNLNVKIKTFRMEIQKNSDLSISFDGINFEHSLEITRDSIITDLEELYPAHTNQWAANGFIPVSTSGIPNSNTSKFNNSYLAFDLFIRNDTGSPVSDNLYLQDTTIIQAVEEDISEEMLGLVNSFRIGIVRIGDVPLNASVEEIQSITCNNNCSQIIYEPNSKNHTDLAIERASKHDIEVVDGIKFPTYSAKKAGSKIFVKNSIPGPNLDTEYFTYQETRDDNDFDKSIFEIPNGITKVRIYVWIEGQDIDSLETDSIGAEVEIGIDFTKDTAGWDAFDE